MVLKCRSFYVLSKIHWVLKLFVKSHLGPCTFKTVIQVQDLVLCWRGGDLPMWYRQRRLRFAISPPVCSWASDSGFCSVARHHRNPSRFAFRSPSATVARYEHHIPYQLYQFTINHTLTRVNLATQTPVNPQFLPASWCKKFRYLHLSCLHTESNHQREVENK